ncbi:MAG: septum formation family protein [Actinomycetota bacterium]
MGIAKKMLLGAGIAGLAVTGCTTTSTDDASTRDDAGTVVESGEVGAFRLQEGDCFGATDDGLIATVDAVPCTEPHQSEVYATFTLAYGEDDAFPGQTVVDTAADDGCYERFDDFVGRDYESSIYGYGSLTPTVESWNGLDDREVLCVIGNYDESPKTGSAGGTGR